MTDNTEQSALPASLQPAIIGHDVAHLQALTEDARTPLPVPVLATLNSGPWSTVDRRRWDCLQRVYGAVYKCTAELNTE